MKHPKSTQPPIDHPPHPAPLERALGLCARARGLVCGTPMVCEALQRGRLALVLVACDVSPNTDKRLSDRCGYYGVRRITLPLDAASLARAVGKTAQLAAVGVGDPNLCRLVEGAWEKLQASPDAPDESELPRQNNTNQTECYN